MKKRIAKKIIRGCNRYNIMQSYYAAKYTMRRCRKGKKICFDHTQMAIILAYASEVEARMMTNNIMNRLLNDTANES